jgi:hypothetical protein
MALYIKSRMIESVSPDKRHAALTSVALGLKFPIDEVAMLAEEADDIEVKYTAAIEQYMVLINERYERIRREQGQVCAKSDPLLQLIEDRGIMAPLLALLHKGSRRGTVFVECFFGVAEEKWLRKSLIDISGATEDHARTLAQANTIAFYWEAALNGRRPTGVPIAGRKALLSRTEIVLAGVAA